MSTLKMLRAPAPSWILLVNRVVGGSGWVGKHRQDFRIPRQGTEKAAGREKATMPENE